jgi:ADP-heptose:LPS heptosyltransferase
MAKILFHVAGGIGNIIMTTPAVRALAEAGEIVDVFVEGDSSEASDIFRGWSIPRTVFSEKSQLPSESYDFYLISWLVKNTLGVDCVKDSITLATSYHGVDGERSPEYAMYLHYARAINRDSEFLYATYCGRSEREFPEITKKTLVLYPGSQERFPMKRWDKFAELAGQYRDVAIVGSSMDLSARFSLTYPHWVRKYFGARLGRNGRLTRLLRPFADRYVCRTDFPDHVKNYIGKLSLADTASLISQAGGFIGNDGGLSHIAAAVGIPTFVIFGPTDVVKNTVPMSNVHVITKQIECQPCQFGGKYPKAFTSHYIGCPIHMQCLKSISCDELIQQLDFHAVHLGR